MKRVFFLVLQGVEILDLAGPAQVFDTANRFGGQYELHYVGPTAKVRSAQAIDLRTSGNLPVITTTPSLILVPGVRSAESMRLDRETAGWLREASNSSVQFASVCSGAFVLGSAGLLASRRCTTHWSLTNKLQSAFPHALVQEAALFVEDKGVTTSAGIASGIDMALSIVERDHGPVIAAKVAREMVVYLRRDGSDHQTSIYLQYRTHLHPGVHRVQDWLISHFTEPVLLSQLGRLAGLSGRHFSRQFKGATGLTPLAYQQRLRLELASSLLHDPTLTMEAIAERCGFDDARSLRRLWNIFHGHSPSVHRTTTTTA